MAPGILIVDDEKDIVDLVAYNVEKEGYKVFKAYDGEGALRAARSEKPDLIVLDLMLPGIQGLEVCKRIRRNPETAGIPIIMLTAEAEVEQKIRGLRAGADDYLVKPFDLSELVARVGAVARAATASASIFWNRGSPCSAARSPSLPIQSRSVRLDFAARVAAASASSPAPASAAEHAHS